VRGGISNNGRKGWGNRTSTDKSPPLLFFTLNLKNYFLYPNSAESPKKLNQKNNDLCKWKGEIIHKIYTPFKKN